MCTFHRGVLVQGIRSVILGASLCDHIEISKTSDLHVKVYYDINELLITLYSTACKRYQTVILQTFGGMRLYNYILDERLRRGPPRKTGTHFKILDTIYTNDEE